jgi:excinuclease ABC subunit C
VIQRVYAEESVPAVILMESEPDGADVLREWLGELRGAMPKIHVPKKGEKVELLQMAQENARLALERKYEPEELNKAILQGLQAFLDLSHLPAKIECFDISHGQGREVVASCVVFSGGIPDKGQYRRFKLSNEQNDDFSNMAEVLTRRYKRLIDEGTALPNLVLVDGGLGQLHVAEAVLKNLGIELELASLAKKEELVYRPTSTEPLRIPKSSPMLQLLQRIRDEAHRFAVTYHRSLRAKRTIQTELTGIQGIGPATAKKMLQEFGSVAKVRAASEPDLIKIVGRSAAAKIIAWRSA